MSGMKYWAIIEPGRISPRLPGDGFLSWVVSGQEAAEMLSTALDVARKQAAQSLSERRLMIVASEKALDSTTLPLAAELARVGRQGGVILTIHREGPA